MKNSSEISLNELVSAYEYATKHYDNVEKMWDFLLDIADGDCWMRFMDFAQRHKP